MSISHRIGLAFLLIAWATSLAGAAEPADPLVLEDTWQETMLATHAQYTLLPENARATLGPWWTTGALNTEGFAHALFPEQGVALDAKDSKERPLWHGRPNWEDAQVHDLKGKGNSSTYLYRTITVARPKTLTAAFGSDDGLEVWLNGAKLLSKDVPRGIGPNQDRVPLELKSGKNHLLLKVYNRTGANAFWFDLVDETAAKVWRRIEQAFPVEIGWMRRDVGAKARWAWFGQADLAQVEQQMIEAALKGLGEDGAAPRDTLATLSEAKRTTNRQWLDLYVRVCLHREAVELLERADLEPLRLAIQDMARAFPEHYTSDLAYLNRLDRLEGLLHGATQRLTEGDAQALAEADETVREIEALRREALLANPLLDFDQLLVVKRGAAMLGLPQNWQGNCAIPPDGYENEIALLSLRQTGEAMTTLYRPKNGEFVGDLDLHPDAARVLFSMPDANKQWQLWEIQPDASELRLRQVTPGIHAGVDNYDACYLPDGRIMFASTRCFQGIPCVGGSNTVANLCIMDADGSNIRQLCFDQDHNWCPTVLNNGRVLFSRWEYSDTPHYFSRLLFHMNPDGTGQTEYYGSNSFWPNSIFYARPIPGHPTKVVAIVSGHHGVPRMGELILFDPALGRHESSGAVQRIPGRGEKVEPIIRDQLVNSSWPRFLHPYPLSDNYFLVSCQPTPHDLWGIYLVDAFDNILLIHEIPGYALLEPIPFRATDTPPIIPDRVRPDRSDATVYLADVYRGPGLKGVPRGTVKNLRVYEFHYSYPQMGGHINVGVEGPWDVHRILGTVPVFSDGSALFTVPANTPIAVQPLDVEGRAIQVMRSWFTAMPGEQVSCVGCHESQNTMAPSRNTIASRSMPAQIAPWYGPARGFSFKRDVQPMLDQYCVGCHDGTKQDRPDLSAKEKNGWSNFTPSYLALHPYVRRPGPESDYHLAAPLEWHAGTSELIQMLEKGHHGVQLDHEGWDRLVTWIDLNVPDHGTWGEHRKIPGDFHQQRLEMRTLYANRPEDPEFIPAINRAPVEFVAPQPVPTPAVSAASALGWPFDAAVATGRQTATGPLAELEVSLGQDVTLKLTLVPAGEFVMGAAAGCTDEQPMTRVAIDEPFYMGRFEVTNRQYRAFDPAHDSGVIDQHNKDHTLRGYPANDPDQPVIRVSWNDAMGFCRWLSGATGRTFSLPTEAQWEWACRAGSMTPFSYGGPDTDFSTHANLADVSIRLLAVAGINPQPIANPNPYQDFVPKDPRFNDGQRIVTEVGKYAPNIWGLFDMHGNVAEWTRTDYKPYPYDPRDGRNALSDTADKVVRGGSWRDRPKRATSTFRLGYRPYQPVFNVGFRIVCPVSPAVQVAATER